MSIQTKVKAFHVASAAHHTMMARLHKDAMEKSDMESGSGFDHAKASDAHASMAEYHCECAKADMGDLEKAFGIRGDGLEPMPEGLSVITPNAPGVRMVPRAGQREIGSIEVDPAFKKIVAVDEDEENQ